MADINLSRSTAIITDSDGDGVADPGDTLRVTVTISNTTASAITAITLEDTLTGSTLVGSVNISPLAVNDSYSAVGNTLLLAGGASGTGPALTNATKLTANDIEFLSDTVTVDAATVTSAQGGSVTINADGSFSYISAAGYTGSDSFSYTIRDDGIDGIAGNADDLTSTATATITVSDQVWYVDATSGSDTTGTGTSTKPFATVTKAATVDGASDYIYVKGSATGTITMEQGEHLIGTGSALVVGGNTLAAAGTRSTITGSSGYTVTLAGGDTGNNEISGINVVATGFAVNGGILGTSFGTLTVNNATIDSSLRALQLSTGVGLYGLAGHLSCC